MLQDIYKTFIEAESEDQSRISVDISVDVDAKLCRSVAGIRIAAFRDYSEIRTSQLAPTSRYRLPPYNHARHLLCCYADRINRRY